MSSLPGSKIVEESEALSVEQFWTAAQIWHDRPHVANRRLCGIAYLFWGAAQCRLEVATLLALLQKFEALNFNELVTMSETQICDKLNTAGVQIVTTKPNTELSALNSGVLVTIRKLLPRSSKLKPHIELTITDREKMEVIFTGLHNESKDDLPVLSPQFTYSLCYNKNKQSLMLMSSSSVGIDGSLKWLKTQLFPKLVKWAVHTNHCDEMSVKSSLTMVSLEKYNSLYQQLKIKYAQKIVEVWPESTDPGKFVHEDVAIAAYLLLLWEGEREKERVPKQSFADLGCGNGLLVHILSSEGYRGVGYDVRKRKIWDLYPPSTKLEVRPIIPSVECLFPDTDWLIGNHSDELTPWIPVFAARSSYTCRFFLLPCCPYEFNGQKYQRANASVSQYSDYLKYILSISETCGFTVDVDKLRIPSTKRTCLIGGLRRSYPIEDSKSVDCKINSIISCKCETDSENKLPLIKQIPIGETSESVKLWSTEFKPRESKERVRNCTQLNKDLVNDLVNIVVEMLLSKQCRITINGDESGKTWNVGGRISLSKIASSLPTEKMQQLKKECGGIQTLLKNHHHIFIVEKGEVRFRLPTDKNAQECVQHRSKARQRSNFKNVQRSKPCWFHSHHPDGCPLTADVCSYKH